MDRSKLLVVDAFPSQLEADLAQKALESAGIRAMVQADSAGGMDPAIAWCGFGFKVLVREQDAVTAREVLMPPESNLVVVQVFGTQAEADLAQGALLEAGIVATVEEVPTDSLKQGRAQVLVSREDASAAREALNVDPSTKPIH